MRVRQGPERVKEPRSSPQLSARHGMHAASRSHRVPNPKRPLRPDDLMNPSASTHTAESVTRPHWSSWANPRLDTVPAADPHPVSAGIERRSHATAGFPFEHHRLQLRNDRHAATDEQQPAAGRPVGPVGKPCAGHAGLLTDGVITAVSAVLHSQSAIPRRRVKRNHFQVCAA